MSNVRAVEKLIGEYAELVDNGDFAGVAEMFADGVFIAADGTQFRGREAVEKMLRDRVILYDGSPRTHHVTTNLMTDADEQAEVAIARSYVTIFQAAPGSLLQPIAAGRYRDRFERHDGRWRFTERHVEIRLLGEMSHHLRP